MRGRRRGGESEERRRVDKGEEGKNLRKRKRDFCFVLFFCQHLLNCGPCTVLVRIQKNS